MIKKFLTIYLAIFFFLFISNKFLPPVQAGTTPSPQQANEALAPQVWRCLKAEQVGGQTTEPPPEVDINLTGAGYPSLYDIYVVMCVASEDNPTNYRCTTGNSEYDPIVFNADLTGTVHSPRLEVPKGSRPPQTIRAVGDKVNVVAHLSNADGHVGYAFFGVTVIPQSTGSQYKASTIQYGTFPFEQKVDDCVSIRWDPYGRVFDSQSLEPITGVSVSLLNRDKQLFTLQGLVNPQITKVDGQFNFLVSFEEGAVETFYLNAVPLAPLLHTFTATPNLLPN